MITTHRFWMRVVSLIQSFLLVAFLLAAFLDTRKLTKIAVTALTVIGDQRCV